MWPRGVSPGAYRDVRTGTGRSLVDTPLEEIVNAMSHCGVELMGTDEERFRATLAVFGQKRLTATSQVRLESAWKIVTRAARQV